MCNKRKIIRKSCSDWHNTRPLLLSVVCDLNVELVAQQNGLQTQLVDLSLSLRILAIMPQFDTVDSIWIKAHSLFCHH